MKKKDVNKQNNLIPAESSLLLADNSAKHYHSPERNLRGRGIDGGSNL